MKKTYLLLLITLIIGLLSGCGLFPDKEKAAQAEKEINNENITTKSSKHEKTTVGKIEFEGITMKIPESFKRILLPDDSGIPYILYEFGETTSFNVIVEDLSDIPEITLEEYRKNSIASKDLEYISNEYYELNGKEVNEVVALRADGIKLQQTTMIHNGKGYVFTYGPIPENYEKDLPVIKGILKSVSFID